jgi:hypothetical protein
MMPPGDAAEVMLTHDVYTPAAIEQTIVAFHHLCEVEARIDGEATHVRFDLKTGGPSTVPDDFLNYVLELSAQELLSGGA